MDPIIAQEAIGLIRVRYEELKPIITIEVRTTINYISVINAMCNVSRGSLKKIFN